MGSWTEVLGLLPKVLGFDVTQGHDAGDAANRSQGRLQPLPPVLSRMHGWSAAVLPNNSATRSRPSLIPTQPHRQDADE